MKDAIDYRSFEPHVSYAGLAGLSLGTAGTAVLLLHMSDILLWPRDIILPIVISCLLIAGFLILVLISLIICTLLCFLHDLNDVTKSPPITAANMALMNIGAVICLEYDAAVGRTIWIIGLCGHCLFYTIFVSVFLCKILAPASSPYALVHAGFFVPLVGITVASTTCAAVNECTITAPVIWCIGATGWLIFVIPVMYKYYSTYYQNNRSSATSHSASPVTHHCFNRCPRHPVGAIAMAPISLLVAGSISSFSISSDSFHASTYVAAPLLILYVIMLVIGTATIVEYPRFIFPLSPALSAITFPCCIFAIAQLRVYAVIQRQEVYVLAYISSVFALLCIVIVLICYVTVVIRLVATCDRMKAQNAIELKAAISDVVMAAHEEVKDNKQSLSTIESSDV